MSNVALMLAAVIGAHSGMNWTAVAGYVVGGAGLVGAAVALVGAERQLRHASREARAGRLFEVRAAAYREAGRELQRMRLYVERTYPDIWFGPEPQAPESFSDEDWEAFTAARLVTASDDVLEALKAAERAVTNFSGYVMSVTTMKRQPGAPQQLAEATTAMRNARVEAREVLDEAFQKMREELASL